MYPFNRQRQALLISQSAFLLTFVFPNAVKHFHQGHETTKTLRLSLLSLMKDFSHLIRSGFIIPQGQ